MVIFRTLYKMWGQSFQNRFMNVKNWALKNQSSEKLKRRPKILTLGSNTKQGFRSNRMKLSLSSLPLLFFVLLLFFFSELAEKLWSDQTFQPLRFPPWNIPLLCDPHLSLQKEAPNPYFLVSTPRKMKSESNVWPAPLKRFSESSKYCHM